MSSAARRRPPARHPANLFPNTLDADLHPSSPKPLLRRRIRKTAFPGASTASGGRRSGPCTPLLRWKFDDLDRSSKAPTPPPLPEAGEKPRRRARNGGRAPAAAPVSARRLAAGIWHLRPPEFSGSGGGGRGEGSRDRVGPERVPGHIQAPLHCNTIGTDLHSSKKNGLSSPISVLSLKSGDLQRPESVGALPNCAMERATKWDPESSKASNEVHKFCSHLKLPEDQQVTALSVVSTLHAELEQAHARIGELKAERRSAKKKLDYFFCKLAEEKKAWRRKEHEKVRAVIDGMKDDLNRERKNRQRMEFVNSRLVNELAEAKLSAKRLFQDYEKERKACELMEEVCDELAKEIADDKAEVEALKSESVKIREEVDEERKMLQMAEVWREERVQMKLVDAKLTLEERYSQMSRLQEDIETFLRERSSAKPDAAAIREAQLLREAVDSVKVQEIKEFSYQPPLESEDIFAVFEELQPREETNERELEPCNGNSPASHATKIHTLSPATDEFLGKTLYQYSNGVVDRNSDVEDDSGWETISQYKEEGSSFSPEGSDPSVDEIYEESNATVSGADWDEQGDNGKLNGEINEIYPEVTRQARKKSSSIYRLWRSSHPNNGDDYKKDSVEMTNGTLSNGRISNGSLSPKGGWGETGLSPASVEQLSSPDSMNPSVTRGTKGCIEWPRGSEKHSLKAKLLEARMESQKIQLRQALKQKI